MRISENYIFGSGIATGAVINISVKAMNVTSNHIISGCYIEGNAAGDTAIIVNDDGSVSLNLKDYYIVPKDKYHIVPLRKIIKYGNRQKK